MSSTEDEQKPERKTFIPLENNPEVFSHLVHKLGVSPSLGFYDVYSIDDASLLAFIPRPAHALLFICPSAVYHRSRATEPAEAPYAGRGPTEPVIWFKQTIGHACGLIGVLHAVANGAARRDYVAAGSVLDALLAAAVPLGVEERARLLHDSEALERAHAEAARLGDTAAPRPEEPNFHHYICFVKGDDGGLWELEGGWTGPIRRGELEEGEDVLSEKALDMSVRPFLKHAGEGNLDFSIVALAPSLD
ncbi:ubiquitin carboxyl-terminal hydrolase isozyme L3 [Lineolata rhizophorae]|uniref:Ubiquitin carboxyl-terminal hydrolase n=1 Tax=Lineolata rhizophorae TaxID=578093 RepID=A0A6A6NS33_9PEZI|nr:ubiquitin carboxyl-terminal hydrolase isozyme L3 [Lineolata rhizophorae]